MELRLAHPLEGEEVLGNEELDLDSNETTSAPSASPPQPIDSKNEQKSTRRSAYGQKKRNQGGRTPTNGKSRRQPENKDPPLDSARTSSVPYRAGRKGIAGSKRRNYEAGNGSDEEGTFLVEMNDLSPVSGDASAQEELLDPESGEGRRKNQSCFCIHWIVVALSVLTSYWLNFGLVVVPFPILLYFAGWNRGALFILAYISLFPLSTFLKTAQLSFQNHLPEWAGSIVILLLRNAAPLMLGGFGVKEGNARFVQGLVMGIIVHRLLLVLGLSVAIHSKASKTSRVEDRSARVAASILYMGVVILIMPGLFAISTPEAGLGGLLKISRWCALFLLILLGFFFLFSLKTHDKFWDPPPAHLMSSSVGIIPSIVTAIVGLIASIISSYLVLYSAPYVYANWGLGYSFIAGILLPIALNAADTIDSVKLAYISNIKSTTLDAIRACLEVCLYLAPILVLAGWISSKAIGLHFAGLVAMSGILSIVNLALLLNALKVTWIQGAMMTAGYLLFSVSYFLLNE